MEHDAYNELTAAYALDALDDDESRAYEEHLAGCAICQDTLAALSGTSMQLAFAAPPVNPRPELRERILAAVRAERDDPAHATRRESGPAEPTNVVPLRPRRTWTRPRLVLAAAVAVAACLVIGLGVWNVSLSNRLDEARSTLTAVPLQGANGSVVVGAGNNGVLVVSNLDRAPAGKTYEAWVIDGGAASPAGTFRGGGTVAVKLDHPVRSGSVVAVTVEPGGGSQQPTSKPFIT